MYRNGTDKGGASNYPLVMMIKCMMLQKWFNLSHPMLEEMLCDRISFRQFVGLKIAHAAPDETNFVRFRKRLNAHGHIATDRNDMIKDYRFDTASTHDSKHIDEFIENERHSVWADSAYMDKNRKAKIQECGVFCGIIQRKVRGQKELTTAQKLHNRNLSQSRRKRSRPKKVTKQVPVRTFADWNGPNPGYLETDFVVHGGGFMAGSFIHTLITTDVSSGWTEFIPLRATEQSLVVEGLDVIFQQIPFPILGIDSDNDSAFINDTLLAFCQKHHIEFTRSRAYHKNDQAWVEQKNGAVIRRMVGYERFSGVVACQALYHLYQAARLYVNHFQPSFKLRRKTRDGSKVKRTYEPPATPCDRLLQHPAVDDQTKEKLRLQGKQLDPVKLLHSIREGQSVLAALTSTGRSLQGPGRENLDQFLAQLPRLWRDGEVRATHRAKSARPRRWRTRKDPFESVWYEVLGWLQQNPDATAKSLFERLQDEYPNCFADGQLRTLQRRVKEWRKIMARELVYACMEQ